MTDLHASTTHDPVVTISQWRDDPARAFIATDGEWFAYAPTAAEALDAVKLLADGALR